MIVLLSVCPTDPSRPDVGFNNPRTLSTVGGLHYVGLFSFRLTQFNLERYTFARMSCMCRVLIHSCVNFI
jgi:hypothetical protein